MTLQDALKQSATELRRHAEAHQCLLAEALDNGTASMDLATAVLGECPHKQLLRQTLIEAIAVLNDTRKSFKSKKLEELRRKLEGVLAQEA